MHGLRNMFYFERKKHYAVFLPNLFIGICLPQCSFFFLADLTVFWKGVS